jgi:hypothetical protein
MSETYMRLDRFQRPIDGTTAQYLVFVKKGAMLEFDFIITVY